MNGSFASPVADAHYAVSGSPESGGLLSRLINDATGWTVLTTILLVLIAYDQSELARYGQSKVCLTLTLVIVNYWWNKGSIIGPAWKMPFIGPFLESTNPKMERYKAKWASGDLSCVSVFHKYVW